jgi:formylglycine-generating enzyme required for sulfatase activity
MGRPEKVWPVLAHSPDPTVRTYLIERLGPGGADPALLEERLAREPDVSVRRALLLALGSMGTDRLPESERERLAPRMVQLFRDDPDPGVHGAARWVLGRWGKADRAREVESGLVTGRPEGDRAWYVNRQGQSFTVVAGPDGGRYAIAATEVTIAQFLRFRREHKDEYVIRVAPTEDCPLNNLTWYDAAAYCNWLSRQEGIPEDQWCYRPDKDGRLEPAPDWQRRTGYRLPTDAEWERAALAGASTTWSFGEVEFDGLEKYARIESNAFDGSVLRTFSVGSLKPNDLGLFDMFGNVAEWCQDIFVWPHIPGLSGRGETLKESRDRVVRGGSYLTRPDSALMRALPAGDSTWRTGMGAAAYQHYIGFRPARTLPPPPPALR